MSTRVTELGKNILGATMSLVLHEGQWILDGIEHANQQFIAEPKDKSYLAEIFRWRRLAFRLFPSHIEALSNTNRDLSLLATVTGASKASLSRKVTEDRQWRRLAMNQRFNAGIEAVFEIHSLTRAEKEKVELSDLLAQVRQTRRQLAHPKGLTDLFADDREVEVLRRAIIQVHDLERRVVAAVAKTNERSSKGKDELVDRPLRAIPSQRKAIEALFDAELFREIEESEEKSGRLVHIMSTELGHDSLWALSKSKEYEQLTRAAGRSSSFSHGGRILGVTFLSEIEGVCAILGRAVLYANSRGEVNLTADEVEYLECVCGERRVQDATDSTRNKMGLEDQIELTIKAYEKISEHSASELFRAPGQNSVTRAIELRDKMYHPKVTDGFFLSPDDTLTLCDAMQWFRAVVDRLTLGST